MQAMKICIAGLGNVGSHVVDSLSQNEKHIFDKTLIKFEINGISAKNKNKKRIFNCDNFKWYENPFDLINNSKSDVFIELIGLEKGISYELIKIALNKKLHVITANKALIAYHGNELFRIAEQNKVLLLFEAAVSAGVPIIRVIKQSLYLNKIKKISGILNGTTNFILSQMYKTDLVFVYALKDAQKNGFAEANPKNDIEGIDAAYKLVILSVLCFGVNFNFNNVIYKGISNITNQDIKFSKHLG